MRFLSRALYSNQIILQQKAISRWLILLLILLTTSITSSSLIIARSQVDEAVIFERFDHLDLVLEEVLATTDCRIDLVLQCESTILPRMIQGYQVVFFTEPTEFPYVAFLESRVIVATSEDRFVGGYRFFEGRNFQELLTNRTMDAIVYGLATATIGEDFTLIWLIQFIQNLLLFSIISAMLLFSNFRRNIKHKLSYSAAYAIAVVAYLGPALVGGFFGLLEPTVGGITTVALYSVRMMNLYFGIYRK
jgi:hypothetical protein